MSTNTQVLWAVTPEKIAEAVRCIVETTSPVKIIAFGSYARGDAKPESDLDLMVVEESIPDTMREAARLHKVLQGLRMSVDIIVVDRGKFDYWKDTPGNVYFEAAQDGRALYETA